MSRLSVNKMRDYLYGLATDKEQGFLAGIFKIILFGFSLIYALVIAALKFIYRLSPNRLNCRVISVGNITLGGTGKTSLVEFIAKYLEQQGQRVAILSRGYKQKGNIPADEPAMLEKNLKNVPVIVDANRIRAGKEAIEKYGADTVILDDGFQQWKLKKDLEIVTVDATNPFGNRWVIPRGILREPVAALKEADILVLTKTNLNPGIMQIKNLLSRINRRAILVEATHQPLGFYALGSPDNLLSLDSLKGVSVTAFSGIADPASFENLLGNLGVKIGLSFRFSDHHHYSPRVLADIIEESKRKNITTIVTTEKDAVRLNSLKPSAISLQLLVLRIALKITQNEEGFLKRLLSLYHA